MLIDRCNQQITLWRSLTLELCFGTKVKTNQAKIEKIPISRAIQLGFMRSLVSAIRCEAMSILLREERPIGSRTVKMLRDLLLRALCLVQHVAAANARAEVRDVCQCATGQHDVKDRHTLQVV